MARTYDARVVEVAEVLAAWLTRVEAADAETRERADRPQQERRQAGSEAAA